MTKEEREDSSCIGHEPCPKCGSQDNLGRYTDGHGFCFGCGYYEHGDGKSQPDKKKKTSSSMSTPLMEGDYRDLPKRSITKETCKHMGYRVGIFTDYTKDKRYAELDGKPCQIADYKNDEGVIVAQKLRFEGKDFLFVGDTKQAHLYGKTSAKSGGRKVVVTEGEIDALTVSQLQGNKWPVVSVSNGAQGAAKCLKKELQWLDQFDEVILFFDDDDVGRAATVECVDLFAPGKVKIARVPGYKDANEAHLDGQGAKVIEAIWNAKPYRPDGLLSLAEIIKEGIKEPTIGTPWFSPTLTKLTFGRRFGETYTFGAGTGIGKTDFLLQQAAYDAFVLKEPIGLFFLEQDPRTDISLRMMGKMYGKPFHLPKEEAGWTVEQYKEAEKEASKANVILYSSKGSRDWEEIRRHIRYLRHQEGVRIIYLDNLTSMVADESDVAALDAMVKQIATTMQELGVMCHLVSHLSTPKDTSHEEGGRVRLNQFRGSRAIGFWPAYAFGIERNPQAAEEEERKIMTLRVIKDRYSGRANGKTVKFDYDTDKGQLIEQSATDHGF